MSTETPNRTPSKTLEIDGLRLTLPNTARPVLDGVDLAIGPGETVALVGESGSGKTLTSRSALGLLPRGAVTEGSVRVAGEDVLAMTPERLRELRAKQVSMIFQDPRAAMNPLRRVEHFLTESLRTNLGRSKDEARLRALEMLDAVGLPERVLRQRPHELSGGMLQRIMIAAALMADPVLLLADEPTTALDVTTQAEIVALLADLQSRFGTALLFVTHDLELAAAIADRVYVMYAGRIVETDTADALFSRPRHPYSAALLASTPRLDAPTTRLTAIPGQPPNLLTALSGCAFATRCPHATERCVAEVPLGDPVACHYSGELTLQGGKTHG
jgi:peptide/nickel transport system ATP-binding protein